MSADKRDYRVVLFPAIWRESVKENKPSKFKINSFIGKLAIVKSILNKWVQYNIELQIINISFVKLTGSAGILLMDVHTKQWVS